MLDVISMLISTAMVFLWLNERAWRKEAQRSRDEAFEGWRRSETDALHIQAMLQKMREEHPCSN